MRQLCFLLAAFSFLSGCAPQATNSAKYVLAGRSFSVPARALAGMGTPAGREGLDIEVGRRPLAPGEGTFLVSYEKTAGTPESAYRLTLLTYTYNEAPASASYRSVSYTSDLHGTLSSTQGGELAGTFYGTLPDPAPGAKTTVRGSFKVAAPANSRAGE